MAIRHGTMLSSCDINSLVEITSRKTIKPSSPTPPHNRILKLSLLDQIMPPTVYGTILWFFPNHNASDFASKSSESTTPKSKRLQDSLSKALVQFYPMAGRVKSPALIECNDEGAHFLEARVNCQLSDLLIQPNPESLNHLMAQNDPKTANEALGSTLLLVQISVFNCGGIVVSVSASHKIADAASFLTFVRAWAAINRDGVLELQLGTPEFTGGSLLPPRELSLPSSKVNLEIPTQSLVTKRFVFNVSKMVSLKEKIGSVVQAFIPSTSHLVLAIILKCSIAASRQCKPESSIKPTVLSQMVSFRKRIVPEKSENVMGNWFWPIQVLFKENEIELHDLASKMRQGLTEFRNEKASRFKGEDGFLVISECLRERNDINSANVYRTSSLCKLPLYEMDFGWGKPAWVTSLSVLKNIILLVDTKEKDGIEAWVTLDEQEMAIFESDQELLAFCSVNPSICHSGLVLGFPRPMAKI
ncbi:acyltransferase Pun1-like [Pyrus communis]|uniref:acyltransferase Pun1-like n=1 Tax=Pyrus communis TaxID=23211 RepID=UPI0035C022BF